MCEVRIRKKKVFTNHRVLNIHISQSLFIFLKFVLLCVILFMHTVFSYEMTSGWIMKQMKCKQNSRVSQKILLHIVNETIKSWVTTESGSTRVTINLWVTLSYDHHCEWPLTNMFYRCFYSQIQRHLPMLSSNETISSWCESWTKRGIGEMTQSVVRTEMS